MARTVNPQQVLCVCVWSMSKLLLPILLTESGVCVIISSAFIVKLEIKNMPNITVCAVFTCVFRWTWLPPVTNNYTCYVCVAIPSHFVFRIIRLSAPWKDNIKTDKTKHTGYRHSKKCSSSSNMLCIRIGSPNRLYLPAHVCSFDILYMRIWAD